MTFETKFLRNIFKPTYEGGSMDSKKKTQRKLFRSGYSSRYKKQMFKMTGPRNKKNSKQVKKKKKNLNR